ncbi:unnamed protein product [Linum trigynum]|uniref:Uncharacterized protein n=1 Tax=Linum trigynum TaxID=586398 RepID=A0AAV2E018_9ROSI
MQLLEFKLLKETATIAPKLEGNIFAKNAEIEREESHARMQVMEDELQKLRKMGLERGINRVDLESPSLHQTVAVVNVIVVGLATTILHPRPICFCFPTAIAYFSPIVAAGVDHCSCESGPTIAAASAKEVESWGNEGEMRAGSCGVLPLSIAEGFKEGWFG